MRPDDGAVKRRLGVDGVGDGDLWAPPRDRRPSRRKVGLIIGAIILAIATAGGVATFILSRNPPKAFERIKPGMTQAQVVGILGVPTVRGTAESGETCWYWERELDVTANGVCFREGRVVARTRADG